MNSYETQKGTSYSSLRKSVPGFVRDEPVLDEIYKRQGVELDRLRSAVSFVKGMIVSITTCSDDGLWFWERLFNMNNTGLSPPEPDTNPLRCGRGGRKNLYFYRGFFFQDAVYIYANRLVKTKLFESIMPFNII